MAGQHPATEAARAAAAEHNAASRPAADGTSWATGAGLRGDAPQWVANLQIQRLLAVGMFACVVWALGGALTSAGVDWPQTLATCLLALAVFAAGVTLGGRSETKSYRRYTEYGLTDWALLLIPILLVLRILPSLVRGPAALVEDVARWMDEPATFWNVGLVWSLILVFLVWDFAHRVAEDLGRLSFQPGEEAPPNDSPRYYDWLTSPYRFVDHSAAWRRLMWCFVSGGFVMLVFTGLSMVTPEQLRDASRPEVQGFMPAVLLYYLLGLVLASQTSLDRLRADWLRGGAAVQPGLARRWLGYGLALMLVALVLALFLPTTFSDQAADQLPLIWRWLWFVRVPLGFVLGIVGWIFSHLIALLLAPIMWLLPRGSDVASAPAAAPSLQPTPVPVDPGGAGGYPSVAARLAWALLLYGLPSALAAYAIWNTWTKRHAIWQALRSGWRDLVGLLWNGLLDLVAVLWRIVSAGSPRLLNLAPAQIRARWRKRRFQGEAGLAGMGWLRLRGLSPRDLILYFYVSLAQRAEAIGWGRGKGQTPYEYSRSLGDRLPERRRELDTLTEEFVRAKYSRRPVDESDARRARGPWERLRGALQARRRAHQFGTWLGLGRDQ